MKTARGENHETYEGAAKLNDQKAFSFAGLFWFSDDYARVTNVVGEVEFTSSDLIAKKEVMPKGEHCDYVSRAAYAPRGRVVVRDGEIRILIGLKCPDEAVKKVVDYFGLNEYLEKVKVVRGYHWDKK